jgi:hypothetical protein
MSDFEISIGVVDTETGWTVTRIYSRSPVSVGSDSLNDLRLRGPDVASHHGEVLVEPESLAYRSLARRRTSHVDGVRVKPRQVVALTEHSVVIIGSYRIDAVLRRLDATAPGLTLELRPPDQVLAIEALPAADPAPRALEMLAIFSSGFCGLKRHLISPCTSTLYQLDEPAEVVAYLLDASGSDGRLDELREAQHALVARAAQVASSDAPLHE